MLRASLADWGDDGRLARHKLARARNRRDRLLVQRRRQTAARVSVPRLSAASLRSFGSKSLDASATRSRRSPAYRAASHMAKVLVARCSRRPNGLPNEKTQRTRDSISFGLSRLDSARASLKQVTSEWRRARLAVERGDPNALRAFRNLNLGLPGTSGTADIDKLFELREDTFQLAQLEQVTAGVDVQSDRLVYTVLGFSPSNIDTWVLDYGIMLGDSREDEVWARLAAKLSRPFGGLPPSVVSVDAGYLTSTVQAQCARRRWWIPCVGRSGSGKPIARGLGPSGVCTVGKDNANSWWSGRVEAGAVHLPRTMTRNEIGELCASEVLVAEGGALRWRPVDGLENHLWDAAINCVHGRFFRTLSAHRRPFRLAAV